jgi:hypothetical protein
MSLINDALRRARQAQPAGASRAATPPLRPVEAAPRPGHGSLFTLPFMGAVVLLVAGITLWGWSRAGRTIDIKVRASDRTSSSETVSIPEPPVTPPLSPPVPVAAAVPSPTTGILSSNVIAVPSVEPAMNGTNLVESPRPEPTSYKLQGIFYKKGNPSAAINGRTVFVGNRIGDARVTAITQESVTIVTGAGETKELQIGD